MAKTIQEAAFEFRDTVRWYLNDTLQQLFRNTVTQCIYPKEIYKGYSAINDARGARGQWHSTGEGVKSFKGSVVSSDPGRWSYLFSYDEHLKFAEMGVGLGTKFGDVQTQKNARYKSRYVQSWKRYGAGRSHRPAIMMELRHLASRMQNYLVDFYGYQGEMKMVKFFENDDIRINL